MVAQLVRQEDGSYDYVEVTEPKKSVAPNLTEFEAYEGAKKDTELVSSPTIEEQTERVIRETPGQYKTPESTEMTALEKVMSMPKQEQIDYSEIMKDAYQATQPTFKDQLLSSALDVGGNLLTNYITKKMTGAAGDIIINNMTRHVLGGTMSGSLAATTSGSMMTGASMVNPYTMAAAALMTKPGQKVAKKAIKTVKKVVKKASSVAKSIADFFSDIRLKTNIEFINKSPSNINIYKFNYIGDSNKYIGVMAHEVPWAARRHPNGYLMVDYNKLDVEFRRIN
jgi:hypothetical protein